MELVRSSWINDQCLLREEHDTSRRFILHISLHHKKGWSNHLIPTIPYIVLYLFFFRLFGQKLKIIRGIREGQPASYLPSLSSILLNLHDIKQWTLDVRALSLSLSLSPQDGVLSLSSTRKRREIMKHLPPRIHVVINNEGPSMPLKMMDVNSKKTTGVGIGLFATSWEFWDMIYQLSNPLCKKNTSI